MRLGPNFLILLSLGLGLLLAAADQTVVAAAMPVIAAQLKGVSQYALIAVGYLLGSTLFLPVGGWLSDRWGRKKAMAAGLLSFAAASAWCGVQFLSDSGVVPGLTPMNEFIAARIVQGACAGIILSSVFIIIADLYSPAQRGRYQGLFAAIWALASLAGPYAGGWLAQHEGWRWIFFINVPIGIIAATILMPARVLEIDDAWRHPYSKREIMELFSNPTILISIVSVFVSGMGMYGGMVLMPLIFSTTMGLNPEQSGQMLTPLVVTTCVFSVVGGLCLSKFKRYKKLVVSGLGLMAAGTLMLLTPSVLFAGLIVAGAGLGLLLPAYTIVIQNIVPEEILGVSTGISQFMRCAGGALGTCSIGFALGRQPMTSACESIFVIYSLLLLLTVVLNLTMQEIPLRSRQRNSVIMVEEEDDEVSLQRL